MNQKGQAGILILVGILIIAALAGGAYYFEKSSTKPSAPATTSVAPQPTASWKTYTSNEYDITFKYPLDWKLSTQNGTDNASFFITLTPPVQRSHLGDNISIDVHANPNNLSIDQFVGARVGGGPYRFKPIDVNGVEAQESLDLPETSYVRRIYIKRNLHIYQIFIQSDADNYLDTFDKLLSTFKFIQ